MAMMEMLILNGNSDAGNADTGCGWLEILILDVSCDPRTPDRGCELRC